MIYLYSQYPYEPTNTLHRIKELWGRIELAQLEAAKLSGLEEFPDNLKMAELATIQKSRQLHPDPITPTEEAVLDSVRLMRKARFSTLCIEEQGMIDRLSRMLRADTESFIKDLDFLLTEKPINILMCDELFKHMLYQRYQIVTQGSQDIIVKLLRKKATAGDEFELTELQKEEVLNLFSQIEDKRQILIDNGETAIPEYDFDTVERDIPYVQHWAPTGGPIFDDKLVRDDTICQCCHGGGFRLLQLILTGTHPGNKLEHQEARGIQVHPYAHGARISRSIYTYSWRSERFFDTPAILFFKVEARYLDGQPNVYEAGIRSEFFEYATDFNLENLVAGEVVKGNSLKDIREAIERSKIGIGLF